MNKLQFTKDKLTLGKYKLLRRIIADRRSFDKKDNTFLLSNRQIAKRINVSPSYIDQLMRTLKQLNLIKPIINIFGDSVIMLDPEYLFFNVKEEKPFNIALFQLGSHDMALQWRDYCRLYNVVINARTNKQMKIRRCDIDSYSASYSMFDRCYRPMNKHQSDMINSNDIL